MYLCSSLLLKYYQNVLPKLEMSHELLSNYQFVNTVWNGQDVKQFIVKRIYFSRPRKMSQMFWHIVWSSNWWPTFSKWRKAYWELNTDLCDTVRDKEPFNNTKILLDMIDTHTFDFLTGKYNFNYGHYRFIILKIVSLLPERNINLERRFAWMFFFLR